MTKVCADCYVKAGQVCLKSISGKPVEHRPDPDEDSYCYVSGWEKLCGPIKWPVCALRNQSNG